MRSHSSNSPVHTAAGLQDTAHLVLVQTAHSGDQTLRLRQQRGIATVKMYVDQTGDNQLAARVDRFGCRRNVGVDRGDPACANGDVHDGVHPLGGVDDAASANNEIVFGCG